jgi:hypothetical protein
MSKRLKLWNGRGWDQRRPPDGKGVEHCYVAAYSRADAVRLINQAAGHSWNIVSDHEIKVYYNDSCWGNTMDGIEPERGVWVTRTHRPDERPERLI